MKATLNIRGFARYVAATVMTVGLLAPVGAETILVDLGNDNSYRGASTPSPDVNGNHWNSVWSGAYYPGLVDTAGNPTSVNLGFSSAGGTDYFNGPSGAVEDPTATVYNAAALGNLGVDNAVYDYYTNSMIEIQGLNPAKRYDLTFYAAHQFNSDPTTSFEIYTDGTYTTLVDSATLDIHQPGSPWLYNQDTVATINGLAPQASNILYLKFVGTDGGEGYLNAFQIEEVPEPSALLLLVSGCGLALALRRR